MVDTSRLPKEIEKGLLEHGIIKEEHTMSSFLDDVELNSIAFEHGLKRLVSNYDDDVAKEILEKHFKEK